MELSPSEVQSEETHISDNDSATVITVVATCFFVAFIAVTLRLISRRLKHLYLQQDDYGAIIALVRTRLAPRLCRDLRIPLSRLLQLVSQQTWESVRNPCLIHSARRSEIKRYLDLYAGLGKHTILSNHTSTFAKVCPSPSSNHSSLRTDKTAPDTPVHHSNSNSLYHGPHTYKALHHLLLPAPLDLRAPERVTLASGHLGRRHGHSRRSHGNL